MHSSDNQQGNSDASSAPARSAPSPATAQGAYPVAPDARGAEAWNTSDAVTDFLGLDQDMVAADPEPVPLDAVAPEGSAELDPSHSWLLAIEGEGPDTPNRGAAHDDPEEAASREALPRRRASGGAKSMAKMAVAAGVVGIAIGAGIVGFVRWQQRQNQPVQVATTTKPAPTPNKAPATQPKPQPPSGATSPTPATDPASTPLAVEPTPSEPTPSAPLASDPSATATQPLAADPAPAQPDAPRYEPGARWSDERVAKFLERFRPSGASAAGSSGTSSSRELAPLALLAPTIDFYGVRSPLGGATNVIGDARYADLDNHVTGRIPRVRKNGRSNLRIASDEDLAGIWEGKTVPLDSIEKSVRLLTPLVGRVRILIHGGEVFEGRLYAVGQSMLWLDTELGRMALEARQMARILHLSSPDGTPVLGAQGSQELDGLPRVRVRTLGGVLYGRLIGRDGNSVTLVTDGGARITVESTEIEPAPVGRSLIVKGAQAKSEAR